MRLLNVLIDVLYFVEVLCWIPCSGKIEINACSLIINIFLSKPVSVVLYVKFQIIIEKISIL